MSGIAMEAARLMDILPEADKEFAFEFIKKWFLPGARILPRLQKKKPKELQMPKTAALSVKTKLTGKKSVLMTDRI